MTRPTGVFKKSNEYADLISRRLYEETPKAVLAALLVSFIDRCSGGNLEGWADMDKALLEEWDILHQNGIVPQKPPKGG